MFNTRKNQITKILPASMIMALTLLVFSWLPVLASDDHDEVRDLKNRGEIIALYELINKAGLTEVKILEAELEREDGKLVYELEFLDTEGLVFEQYFDAITGEAISEPRRD